MAGHRPAVARFVLPRRLDVCMAVLTRDFRLLLQDGSVHSEQWLCGKRLRGARASAKSAEQARPRVQFYAALGLVTAATLMLQIIETRIISVTSWYHLAFLIISIAMFGLTAGAVFVYLRKERFRPERLSYDLAVATLAFALTTDLAILVQLTLVTGASPSLTSFVAWLEFTLCLALPFFFSGVVVSLALTRSPYPIGKVYGADLIGAAIGCIGALVLLNMTSGPSAVLWVGAVIGLAALGFTNSDLGNLHEIRVVRCQTVSLPPQHPHRMPALCDCQRAHDPWRPTDDRQGPVGGAGRSCL